MMTIDEMMNDMMDAVKISYPERKKKDLIDKRVRKYMGIPIGASCSSISCLRSKGGREAGADYVEFFFFWFKKAGRNLSSQGSCFLFFSCRMWPFFCAEDATIIFLVLFCQAKVLPSCTLTRQSRAGEEARTFVERNKIKQNKTKIIDRATPRLSLFFVMVL